MQDYSIIIGIIDMRLRGISYEDCCGRYKVGHSTVTRIMSRYKELDKTLEELKQMAPAEVENKCYPIETETEKLSEEKSSDFSKFYEKLRVFFHPCKEWYIMIKNVLQKISIAPLQIQCFPLLAPRKLVDARKFNVRYSNR